MDGDTNKFVVLKNKKGEYELPGGGDRIRRVSFFKY